MNLAIFAYSRQGCLTAKKIEAALCMPEDTCCCYTMEKYAGTAFTPIVPPCSIFTGPVFAWADVMVFVGSCGIAVRSIAPYVRDKCTDPAVLVVDELGKFVIALLSGHIGGANALAGKLAQVLDAVPVVTTATDIHQKFSVDTWAAQQGLAIDSMHAAKSVSAAILEHPVPLHSDFPVMTDLPNGTVLGDRGDVGICISWKRQQPFDETLLLVPPVLHLGIGCRRGTPAQAIRALVEQVLYEHRMHRKAVKQVASIDLKTDEAGLLEFCREEGWPVRFYSAQELGQVEGEFASSELVQRVTGVDNVCERAALLGAEQLLVNKTARDGVTIAIAAEHWEVRFG